LSIRLRVIGEYSADVATSYGNIGNVYLRSKELDKSLDAHKHAMKIRLSVFGATSPEIVESYVGMGNAFREKKEYDSALVYFQKALSNKILQRGEGHKDLKKHYNNISAVYILMGNKEQGDLYKSKADACLKE
jgi:tetratricopeptide (TPR) repeat protein